MKEIIIGTKLKIRDAVCFEKILLEIKKSYPSVEFLGWLNGFKIVSIDDKNYKVIAALNINRIILKETRSNSISIPFYKAKQEAYERYKKVLK